MAHQAVRHQYRPRCAISMPPRGHMLCHTNGALVGDAPLVCILGIFFFSDICTDYKIYYWTEYKQHHTTIADSSNTIEDWSPNTIHHISLRIQKTEQRQNITSLETASSEFVESNTNPNKSYESSSYNFYFLLITSHTIIILIVIEPTLLNCYQHMIISIRQDLNTLFKVKQHKTIWSLTLH